MHRVNQLTRKKNLLCLLLMLTGLVVLGYRFSTSIPLTEGEATTPAATTVEVKPDAVSTSQPGQAATARVAEAYGKLPLSFEENKGQTDKQVKFLARGHGYSLFLTGRESVLVLHNKKVPSEKDAEDGASVNQSMSGTVLRMSLGGKSASREPNGIDELPGKANYFTGDDSSKWRANVPLFSKVHYSEVYRGVDLVYYGNQRQLEYDFIVSPGADPRLISLNFEGAEQVEITDAGELLLRTKGGDVQMRSPVIYQTLEDGKREEICGSYVIHGRNEVGFEIGDYDPNRTLVIDPVLVYSTYLGGTSSDNAYDITVDASGNAYIAGSSHSTDFPTTSGAFQTKNLSSSNSLARTDAFITKLNPVGNAAIYSTYLGGTDAVVEPNDIFLGPLQGNEEPQGIAVDSAGNVFVVGKTTSLKDFPVTPGAYRTTFERNGATSTEDAFVAKLNAAGNGLIYSTRLGGIGIDQAFAVGIDNDGNAYVTGNTRSPEFPATFGTLSPNKSDAFVVKLNPTGTALIYSALLGSGVGNAIAVDSTGNVYVAGQSYSTNFSVTPGAFQTVAQGSDATGFLNGFVTKINPAGDALIYSTFLGGKRVDEISDLAIDASGNAYVGGTTDFSDFPTTHGAYRTIGNIANGALGGGPFVTKLNPTGSALVYSTYLSSGSLQGLVVNAAGEVSVAGVTDANMLTTNDAVQKTSGGDMDAFVAQLNASGSGLLYSTYLGGIEQDRGTCIAIDSTGAIYVAGITLSTNFPLTQDTFQPTPSGNRFDIGSFVAKFGEATTGQTYRIRGRLTDSNGNGIARARVTLGGSPGGTQFTDTTGNYSFGSLTPGGNYSVTPSSPYYDFNPQSRNFDNLSADQTADFSATVKLYSISGSIKDINGNSIEGVTLTLSGAQSATTQTDVSGNYTFNNLPAIGNYTVTPSKTNHLFSPTRRTFTNLDANQSASFVGRVVYSISGKLLAPAGTVVSGIRIIISNGVGLNQGTTDSNGNYSFGGLPAGDNYTVTPDNTDYTFSPTSQSFNNLSANQTANFTATYRYGSISGRITDADGKGLDNAVVTLSGAQNVTLTTNSEGNYLLSRLLKGNNYTVSASAPGYVIIPAATSFTITGDHIAHFTASLKKPRPFTSGNILVASGISRPGKLLLEYTPGGALVQDVIVPFPIANNSSSGYYLGDLVLDKNGEVEIFNGPSSAAYLTSYSFTQGTWRHHTYPGWNPATIYNTFEGIATFGNYVYVTDKTTNDSGQPVQTQGILRIDISNYSSQRFAEAITFCHLTLGQDGLLYGLVGFTAGSQVNVYNPTTMQLVKTITLTDAQNSPINVNRIAVNHVGEVYGVSFSLRRFDSSGKQIKSVQLSDTITDIEISNSGQLAAGTGLTVTLLDESLNITGSFAVPTGVGHLAFTNTVPPTPIQLMLDESGPAPNQAAALDSVLFLRDPFLVVNPANQINQGADKNTRVIVFVTNLQLAQNETSASVVVNLVGSNTQPYDIEAEDVRYITASNLTQVIFRLPDGLAPGTCTVKVKAHGQESNSGTIRIGN